MINLQFSLLVLRHYAEISGNFARYIINSFFFMHTFITINISINVVYKTTQQVSAFEKHIVPSYTYVHFR